MLEALGGDEALDAGRFGVGFLAFAFGLDFAADDEFADLGSGWKNEDQHYLIQSRSSGPTPPDSNGRRDGNFGMINDDGIDRALTSSSLPKPKNLRILVALLGPNLFGNTLSVRPGISSSPCLMTLNANTDRSIATMQPLTLFLLRSPVRRGR